MSLQFVALKARNTAQWIRRSRPDCAILYLFYKIDVL